MICVDSTRTDVKRQYYCLFCWDTIYQRAVKTYPQLAGHPVDEKTAGEKHAFAHQMGVLLGMRKTAIETSFNAHSGHWANDMRVLLPNECLEDGVPLGAFRPVGEELEAHKREALRRLTPSPYI